MYTYIYICVCVYSNEKKYSWVRQMRYPHVFPPLFKGAPFWQRWHDQSQAAPMKTEFVMITRAKKASNCQASTFLEASVRFGM